MTAHTPGPWTVRDTGDAHCVYAPGSNRPFVTLYHANHGGHDKAADLACLIAAAPDLLAALRAAEDRLALVIECDTDDGKPECAANAAALAQARAAIAKAEGRS